MEAYDDVLGEWLDRELAGVPQELALRVRSALPIDWRAATLASGPAVLAGAAAAELTALLARGGDTRWAAPSLLTIDALVTYACQLLAVSGGDIDSGSALILDAIVHSLPVPDAVA